MLDFKEYKGTKQSLNQIYYSGLRYAMLTPEGEMSCQWMLCKDYLHEVVWNAIHKKAIGIYGLNLPASGPYADIVNPRIVISPSSKTVDFLEGCEGSIRAINLFEEKAGWDKSTLESTSSDQVALFVLNPKWISSPTLISLVTSCMRMGYGWKGESLDQLLGNYKESNPFTQNDWTRLKTHAEKKWWDNIDWNSLVVPVGFSPTANTEVNTLHNNTGIIALLGKVYNGMVNSPFGLWDNLKVAK